MISNTFVFFCIVLVTTGKIWCNSIEDKGEMRSVRQEQLGTPTREQCVDAGCSERRVQSHLIFCARCGNPTRPTPDPSTQDCLDMGCRQRTTMDLINHRCIVCGPTTDECNSVGCYDRVTHDYGGHWECSDCGNPPIFPSTTPAPNGGGGCFPSSATVNCKDGRIKTMSELQVGDNIQIVNHLIYARKGSGDKFIPIHAEMVSNGDEVLVQKNDELTPANIIKVSTFIMQGVYFPLTMEGNIIVDGVLASCYASCDHDVVHIGMSPIQWLPRISVWVFGQNKGILIYVHILEDLGRWLLPTVN